MTSIRDLVTEAFRPGQDRELKAFYRQLDPGYRPGKLIFVCRGCGAGYWDRDRQCTRCHGFTKKRPSWPIPVFQVVGPRRILCLCGHEWDLRRALNFNSQCPSCRGRLLVADGPHPERRKEPASRTDILRDEEWKGDWSGEDPFAEYTEGHFSADESTTDGKNTSRKRARKSSD